MRRAKKKGKTRKGSATQQFIASKVNYDRSLQQAIISRLGIKEGDIKPYREFMSLKGDERIKASHKLIQNSIVETTTEPDSLISTAIADSENLMRGYATLDLQHRAEIQKLIKRITAYLQDRSRRRPLNVLMFAAPGAGKSHFIKRLAAAMVANQVHAVNFNMATMQTADDIAQPIDELRNLKVNDQFPLLFLDEFDSDPSRYAALLPLLWDGELQLGHRDLKLGKAVIILAGSNPELPKVMDQSAKMHLETDASDRFVPTGKLIDLLSRINGGVIEIPELDLHTERRDRRVDKVCIAVSLCKARFGPELRAIPRSLLHFIAQTSFRYGVRSIAHLIDVIASEAHVNRALVGENLRLPIANESELQDSSLKLHLLDKDQAFGIVNRWNAYSQDRTVVQLDEDMSLGLIKYLEITN